jgi:Transposase DDE domain
MFYAVTGEYASLRKIAIEAKSEHSISLTKQGLDDRFSSRSIEFAKKLLQEAIHNQVMDPLCHVATQLFNRVLIKDSTRFDLDESLKDQFPGFGGATSKSCASIQFEFDLKSGEITDLDLQAGLDRDSTDAITKKDDIQVGDLIIRDLGYYSNEVIKSICSKNAYYISRLYHSANVYITEDGKEKVDFQALYKQMQATKTEYAELNVFVGKERTSMRLIICLMPEDVYEKRIRNRNKSNKQRNYNITDEYKARAHFNLFVTNVDKQDMSAETICRFYRIRWQIELAFKVWKTLMKINCIQKMRYDRFVTTLYMNMLWVFVHWRIIFPYRNYLYSEVQKLLSIFKSMDTLKEHTLNTRRRLWATKAKLGKEIRKQLGLLANEHWLEKRKNGVSLDDIFELMFCNSDIY